MSILLASMLVAARVPEALAPFHPLPIESSGSWRAACANDGSCHAVGLPEKISSPEVSVWRGPGPEGRPMVWLRNANGIADLMADGRRLNVGFRHNAGYWHVDERDTSKVLQAIIGAKRLTLIDRLNRGIGTISALGARNVLSYADHYQSRDQTPTAIVLRGSRPMIDISPEIPIVQAASLDPRAPRILSLDELSKIEMRRGCGFPTWRSQSIMRPPLRLDSSHSLALVTISCRGEPTKTAALIIPDRSRPYLADFESVGGGAELRTIEWNPASHSVEVTRNGHSSFGFEDDRCPIVETYVWTGREFEVFELKQRLACLGSVEDIRYLRATMVRD